MLIWLQFYNFFFAPQFAYSRESNGRNGMLIILFKNSTSGPAQGPNLWGGGPQIIEVATKLLAESLGWRTSYY